MGKLISIIILAGSTSAYSSIGWSEECGIEFLNEFTQQTKTVTSEGGRHGYHELGGKFPLIKKTWGQCSFHVGDRSLVPGEGGKYHKRGGREATYGSGITWFVNVGAKDPYSRGWSAQVVRISHTPDRGCSIRLYDGRQTQKFYGPGAGIAPFVSGWKEVVDIRGKYNCRFTAYTGDNFSGKSIEISGKKNIPEGIRSIAIREK